MITHFPYNNERKKTSSSHLRSLLRKMGLEPTRHCWHKILSLACLPIPALPHLLGLHRARMILTFSMEIVKKKETIFLFFYKSSSSYTALLPPTNFARVLAHTTWALPIRLMAMRTGTATACRCMPIKVSPMSMPACAEMCSTATGSLKRL